MPSDPKTAKMTPSQARERAEIAASVAEEARQHVYALLSEGGPDWRRTVPKTSAGKFTLTVEFQP